MSSRTQQRLNAARAVALGRQKQPVTQLGLALVPAGRISQANANHRLEMWAGKTWFKPRWSFALAALVLAIGVIEFSDWQEQAQIDELAEIDLAILADEVPFTAHLDPNYRTLLTRAQ